MPNTTLIPVSVGDTVGVFFSHERNPRLRQAVILRITKRYGHNNDTPLLEGHFLDSNKVELFDNLYVKSVIERGRNTVRSIVNIYTAYHCPSVTVQGGVWIGELEDLARLALSKLFLPIEREINMQKLYNLFDKHGLGLVKRVNSTLWVNHRRFQIWIRRNFTKICSAVRELAKQHERMEHGIQDDHYIEIAERKNSYDR